MTRVNLIPVSMLCNKHLLAEHREIKRIPNKVKNGFYKSWDRIPNKFTLNKGHELFFINKLKFLHNRYAELYCECIKRKFKVTNYIDAFSELPVELYNDFISSVEDIATSQDRINLRLGVLK